MTDDRLSRAFAMIDGANADDPVTIVVRGERKPKELAHAELMSDWVRKLDPSADEAQLLAARAHHLRRWTIPRADFPDGRAGYLRWRTTLSRQHAADTASILDEIGYEQATIDRVLTIIQKRGLDADPAVQTHEDALCIVFLETQLLDLADRLGDERTVDVVRKTLRKMSPQGIQTALQLPLDGRATALVVEAMTAFEKP